MKFELAQQIVERFHGRNAAELAARDFVARFTHHEVPVDLPEVKLAAKGAGLALSQALKQAGLTASTAEALRMIEQGGVKVNGEKVSDKAHRLARGAHAVLQVGKRRFARVTLV